MKNVLLLFFSFYIFIAAITPNYDVEELGKIPFLVEHYKSHKALHAQTSILDFLFSHINISENESMEHSKLPYQSHQMPNFYPLVIDNSSEIIFFTTPIIINHSFSYNHSLVSTTVNSIWQPPKA